MLNITADLNCKERKRYMSKRWNESFVVKSPTLYDSSMHMPNMVRSWHDKEHRSGREWLLSSTESQLRFRWQILRLLHKILVEDDQSVRRDVVWQRMITFWALSRGSHCGAVLQLWKNLRKRRGVRLWVFKWFSMSEQGLPYQDTYQRSGRFNTLECGMNVLHALALGIQYLHCIYKAWEPQAPHKYH
jgi:hypothetical protein